MLGLVYVLLSEHPSAGWRLTLQRLQLVGSPAGGAGTSQCPPLPTQHRDFRVQRTGSEALGDVLLPLELSPPCPEGLVWRAVSQAAQ